MYIKHNYFSFKLEFKTDTYMHFVSDCAGTGACAGLSVVDLIYFYQLI